MFLCKTLWNGVFYFFFRLFLSSLFFLLEIYPQKLELLGASRSTIGVSVELMGV